MRISILLAFAILLVLSTSAALYGKSRQCKGNSQLVGECFEIHGRLFASNGTPSVRIWRIGTKRILGVVPPEDEIIPNYITNYVAFGTQIYADYVVCPFTKNRPDWMQMVCIESADNIVIEQFDQKAGGKKVFHLNHP